eukprot:3937934-Rhodomonas_salina.2
MSSSHSRPSPLRSLYGSRTWAGTRLSRSAERARRRGVRESGVGCEQRGLGGEGLAGERLVSAESSGAWQSRSSPRSAAPQLLSYSHSAKQYHFDLKSLNTPSSCAHRQTHTHTHTHTQTHTKRQRPTDLIQEHELLSKCHREPRGLVRGELQNVHARDLERQIVEERGAAGARDGGGVEDVERSNGLAAGSSHEEAVHSRDADRAAPPAPLLEHREVVQHRAQQLPAPLRPPHLPRQHCVSCFAAVRACGRRALSRVVRVLGPRVEGLGSGV